MPDVVIAGQAPPADISGYPPNTMWMTVTRLASDATGKTVVVNVYVKGTNMPDFVGYNLGGPSQHLEGGPFIATHKPAAWTVAPTATVPGQVTVPNIVVAKPNFYHFEAHAGSVTTHADCQIGKPDETQMGPDLDAEAVLRNTHRGRQAQELINIKDMQRPKANLGGPNNKGIAPRPVRMPRRVP